MNFEPAKRIEEMEKFKGKNLLRKVKQICGGSIDLVDINNEEDLSVLDACLQSEIQRRKRLTMIKILKARIRKIEKKRPETVSLES